MSVVVRVLHTNGLGVMPDDTWVQSWDVEAFDGLGGVDYTRDLDEARVFADAGEAMSEWRTQSVLRPRRDHDGEPNRPLTALTIEVLDLDVARKEVSERG